MNELSPRAQDMLARVRAAEAAPEAARLTHAKAALMARIAAPHSLPPAAPPIAGSAAAAGKLFGAGAKLVAVVAALAAGAGVVAVGTRGGRPPRPPIAATAARAAAPAPDAPPPAPVAAQPAQPAQPAAPTVLAARDTRHASHRRARGGTSHRTEPPPPPPPAAPPATTPAGTVDDAAEEIRLIVGASRAVHGRQAGRALVLLDEHARRFPHSQMRDEGLMTRVLALCGLGRVDDARALARRWLAGSPRSIYGDRVRASCAGDDPAGRQGR